jgi:glycogen synthase
VRVQSTSAFVGYKFGAKLAAHLAAADVFVFPSGTDTFGLVLLEALAFGVPVAAYPVTGPIDIIENGTNGPSAMLLRINQGAGAMHVHTADYHCVVLEGTMQHWEQGQSQARLLQPGSHWFQPGNMAHSDACVTEQCLMYVQWAGPRDARLAEPAKN